jgi:hypothetical protein
MGKVVAKMVLGMKIKLREILITILITLAKWIIDHLSDEGDEIPTEPKK